MWLGANFEICGQKLGPDAKEMPFDRAVWAQWRCYWPFGGGMFTDLFVHQTTHLIAAMGVRYPARVGGGGGVDLFVHQPTPLIAAMGVRSPARVVGGGGIYLEYDSRDVPDTSTI